MKIYKTIVITCGLALTGQCLRTIAHPFMPTDYPVQAAVVTAYSEPLEIAMMRQGEADGLEVLLPSCNGQANMPMFEPCGREPFDPPVNVPMKPVGEL